MLATTRTDRQDHLFFLSSPLQLVQHVTRKLDRLIKERSVAVAMALEEDGTCQRE